MPKTEWDPVAQKNREKILILCRRADFKIKSNICDGIKYINHSLFIYDLDFKPFYNIK